MSKVRVLSLDGGGIRGIVPATVVQYIEEKLIELTGNEQTRIADYFDMIVGTSTGGILACYYLSPNPKSGPNQPIAAYTAKTALEFYADKGYSIFNASKRSGFLGLRQLFHAANYKPDTLEAIFEDKFKALRLSDLLKPCLITTYNMKSKSAFFFSSREPSILRRDFLVKDVARSTSAAPTYFPPAEITNLISQEKMINVDGGVFANNPTMCAYAECRNTTFPHMDKPSAKDMLILSIGTGGGQFDIPKLHKSGKWGVINWAKTVPEIMMDGSFDTVDFQLKKLFGTLKPEHQLNYKRIDVPKDKRIYAADMADAGKENIEKLKFTGKETIIAANSAKEGEHTLDQFIQLLIDHHPEEAMA